MLAVSRLLVALPAAAPSPRVTRRKTCRLERRQPTCSRGQAPLTHLSRLASLPDAPGEESWPCPTLLSFEEPGASPLGRAWRAATFDALAFLPCPLPARRYTPSCSAQAQRDEEVLERWAGKVPRNAVCSRGWFSPLRMSSSGTRRRLADRKGVASLAKAELKFAKAALNPPPGYLPLGFPPSASLQPPQTSQQLPPPDSWTCVCACVVKQRSTSAAAPVAAAACCFPANCDAGTTALRRLHPAPQEKALPRPMRRALPDPRHLLLLHAPAHDELLWLGRQQR